MSRPLQWDVFVSAQPPVASTDFGPDVTEPRWSPTSSTLISGERDAVLVDTFITTDQNRELAEWLAASGKNVTTIYATHGANTIRQLFPHARFIAMPEVVDFMRGQLSAPVLDGFWRPRFPTPPAVGGRTVTRRTKVPETSAATPVRVVEETPAYWRVIFDYPPFNMVDDIIFQSFQDLLARMDASPVLRVVVFESAIPDFYLAHFDLTGQIGNIMTAVGRSGLPILMDTFVRLTKSPVVSIAKIRGCVRGVSSEFVLACDMRFASRENTRLGQPEVGVGVHPGGGGAERLPPLVGRGRALEIILSGNDFDGDAAERYGYVNRALPDTELDGFVDALARRIASFDSRALGAAKNLVNQVSLPSADSLLDALNSFETALTWPETQQRVEALLKRGLQRDSDFEKRWTEALGTLLEK